MFCQKCGDNNSEEAKFCKSCGAPLSPQVESAKNNTATGRSTSFNASSNQTNPQGNHDEMNLVNAFKRVVFENYANFNGRASKSEYWWFYLAYVLISIGTSVIDAILGTTFINILASLGLMVPTIAAATRRLHDTNRSGWWQLIAITIIGIIPLIIWLAQSSDHTENRFGPTPTV